MQVRDSRVTAMRRRLTDDAAATVALVDVVPELGDGLEPEELAELTEALVVPGLRLWVGPWQPSEALARALCALVVSGVLLRDRSTLRRPDVELYGAGDLCDARAFADPASAWRVLVPGEIAVLDARLLLAVRRSPQLVANLARQLFDCRDEQHKLAVMLAMPRVEDRVLTLLSHLAARWGRVTIDGVLLELPVTHELLGRLVGARRPTASLAISALTAAGLLDRMDDGRWLLPAACARDPQWPTGSAPVSRSASAAPAA